MKGIRYCLLLFIVFSTLCVPVSSQGFLKAKGKKIVNEKGENVLLRGIGLGGWMLQEGYMLRINNEGQQYRIRERIEALIGKEKTQQFYNWWLANHTTRADIDSMKAWGFNSVRLPMHYNLYTLPVEKEPVAGQHTWLTKGFTITDSLVSWCKANDMYLILDLHAAPGGQGNDLNISDRDPSKPSLWESEANQQKMIAFWKKIAERYQNETTVAGYDIINEPNWGFEDPVNDKNGLKESKNGPLKKLMMDITQAIREADKNHIVIIEGNGWGNNYKGILDEGLWDDNMVLSFHKYWNFNDQKSIGHIIDYREKYNVPVWLGETGENSNVWFTQAIQLLESNNIGWAWWPLKKLGVNNPLQVKSNSNYDKLVAYWSGKESNPPAANDAYKGLIELAANTNIEHNIKHPDVIDAMIRQPHSNKAKPYSENKISDGAILSAVNYDLGRNGIAYYDKDTANYRVSGKAGVGNRGNVYRNDGVDIYKDSTNENSFYVGNIENGEWLSYTLNVAYPGKYRIAFLVAAQNEPGAMSVTINNQTVVIDISVLKAPAGSRWTSVGATNLILKKGTNVLKITAIKGGFNLKAIGVTKDGNTAVRPIRREK